MLVLSLDTTSRAGSCALVRDGRVVRVQAGDTAREQGGQLPGTLATLLDRESVTLGEIDGYGVAIGPGSFTGLRVGIATMQGLAMATGNPVLPFHLEASSHWTLHSWDRTQIPRPFSTVALAVGEPIEVARDASVVQREAARLELERNLAMLEVRARAILQ